MKQKILSALIAITMLIGTTACTNTSPSSSETNPSINISSEPVKSEVIKVTDHLGREVVFEEPIERIVSGYYITSSLLISLGLSDKVVGIEEKASSRPIYSLAAEDFLTLENVGSAKNFNLEGCIALKPDLVILPIRLKDTVKTLEEMSIKVLAVNPEDEKSLNETIKMISTATGTEDKAIELNEYINDKKTMLHESTVNLKEKPKVYVAGNSEFLSTATSKMYQSSMVKLAGAENVSDDIVDTYWATISYEQLIAYNPEIIVIVPFASYGKEDILKDERLKNLTAVKNGEVYEMPNSFEAWDSPVPSSILGSLWLHSIINEEGYSFDTFKNDTAEFYKTFYSFEIDEDKLTK